MTNLHSDKIKTANLHTTTNHIYTNTKLRKLLVPNNNRAAISLSYGNCGYNDGQQCRFCRYLSGLACRLNQYPCHTGTFSACRRWCDSLFTVSGKSQYKRCPPCCKTGIFSSWHFCLYFSSAFCLITRKPLLRAIFGAVEADVMRNSQVYFFFHIAVISFYRSL